MASRSERLLRWVLAAALVVGLVIVVSGWLSGPGRAEASSRSDRVGSGVVVGGGEASSVVRGAEPSSAPAPYEVVVSDEVLLRGATEAAVGAVEATAEVAAAGRLGRRELVAELVTDDFFLVFMERTSVSMRDWDSRAGDGGVMDEWALRQDGELTGPDSAVVRLWSLAVMTVGGETRQVWRSSELSLRLVVGVWLVDGWESFEGPTPAPSGSALFASGLEMDVLSDWVGVD